MKWLAQLPKEALEGVTGEEGIGKIIYDAEAPTPEALVAGIVQGFLSLLGVIFFALIVYGGVRWMKARGNSQEVDKAREIIINATIGLVVILAAYAISIFVVSRIESATGLGG